MYWLTQALIDNVDLNGTITKKLFLYSGYNQYFTSTMDHGHLYVEEVARSDKVRELSTNFTISLSSRGRFSIFQLSAWVSCPQPYSFGALSLLTSTLFLTVAGSVVLQNVQ